MVADALPGHRVALRVDPLPVLILEFNVPLAGKAPDLVCGINHAFLAGFLTGLRAPSVEATLAPRAGECCVQLHRAAQKS